ncbi:PREDICTED: nucleolar complex protein 2 homolog [Cyphomyrmex costatus]|uniref:Nucleolar complex protein 2 like protein n=1 Tax=Cyphomyrmex costatus TaxID=456900 RepID=A0A195CZY4_9HYME|nr:PREDICTED: nucleolar complex protein 2 homolog [Cyphomyrmex costatus]KYN06176.1 Nucleolar complex protein 2 like protein [Cyphomyrmex costatus]
MKVKKMKQALKKLSEERTVRAVIKKKKIETDLNKLTTIEFFEQDFKNNADSDETDKNTDEDNEQHDSSGDNDDDNSLVDLDDGHISKENLEITSYDSDFSLKETENNSKKVTMQLLKTWQQEIQTNQSFNTIKCIIEAFHAALNDVAVSLDASTRYRVEESATFNSVVQLCITHLPDAFKHILQLDAESQKIYKSRKFEKIQEILKLYLSDLIKLLQSIALSNNAVLTVLLKHLHQMLPYFQSFSYLIKSLLKILLKLWSAAEETVRIIAFLNILHIATSKKFVLDELLETMYEKYVQTVKFVSFDTLPGINFMRQSLLEIYLLDHNTSYSLAFLHIRQLAIDLRNAVTLKNKKNLQAVYNWQYINSLRFWAELITKSKDKSMLRSLLYPLVQIIIGTIKINPTAQYYPLRFHCLKMLITISKETGTFIPILPFLLEILESYDFNKRHKTVTMKPISLVCILRVSKSQFIENGFKDSIIETIYHLILEHAASESHGIYFPDLYAPCIIQLKEFLEKCHVPIYCKKMKLLLNMIEESRKYIETERDKATIDLKNMAEIINWENRMKTDGTAIAKFYSSCVKLHEFQKFKRLTKNKEEFNAPVRRKSLKHKLDEQNAEDSKEDEFKFQMKKTGFEIKANK